MALLLRTDPTSDYLTVILPAFIVLGSGMALTMAPMTAAVMSSVEPEHAGVASAATNTTRELGGVLGIALLGAVVTSSFREHLVTRLTESGLSGPAAASIADKAGSNAASGGGSLATFRSQVPPGHLRSGDREGGRSGSERFRRRHALRDDDLDRFYGGRQPCGLHFRAEPRRRAGAGDAQRAPLPPGPTTRQMPAASRPVTKPAPAMPAPAPGHPRRRQRPPFPAGCRRPYALPDVRAALQGGHRRGRRPSDRDRGGPRSCTTSTAPAATAPCRSACPRKPGAKPTATSARCPATSLSSRGWDGYRQRSLPTWWRPCSWGHWPPTPSGGG